MATSPLFGWEEPDDTDLVKDGAAAIRTLGNAIDASMGDLLGGTTGQVLSKNSNTNMDFTWVTSDDANAIQNTIVDAKGDLISATGSDVPARLAVGADDLLLTAASGEATGLKYTGGWTTWTSSTNGITLGNGTITARYVKIGKFVNWYFRFVLGSTSAITGNMTFTLPIAVVQANNYADGIIYDVGVAGYRCYGEIDGNTVYGRVSNSAATYTTGSLFSSTVPITWGTGDMFVFTGSYEVA
jgi:hypothetical protein